MHRQKLRAIRRDTRAAAGAALSFRAQRVTEASAIRSDYGVHLQKTSVILEQLGGDNTALSVLTQDDRFMARSGESLRRPTQL